VSTVGTVPAAIAAETEDMTATLTWAATCEAVKEPTVISDAAMLRAVAREVVLMVGAVCAAIVSAMVEPATASSKRETTKSTDDCKRRRRLVV